MTYPDPTRRSGELHTSFRTYDLLLMSVASTQGAGRPSGREGETALRTMDRLVRDAHEKISSQMANHCGAYANMFYYKVHESPDGPYCPIDTRKHQETLRSLLKAREERGDVVNAAGYARRHDALEKHWNFPSRHLHCPAEIKPDAAWPSFLCCFGTVDLITCQPTASAMWSGAFRQQYALHPAVSDVISFPMNRVKGDRTEATCAHDGETVVHDESRVQPAGDAPRFVTFSFLHCPPPNNGKETEGHPLSRTDNLLGIADYLLGSEGSTPGILEEWPEFAEHLPGIAVFATQNVTFPILVKGEFYSREEISRFLDVIWEFQQRTSEKSQISTCVAWHDPALLRGEPPVGESATSTDFKMLVKSSQGAGKVLAEIEACLAPIIEGPVTREAADGEGGAQGQDDEWLFHDVTRQAFHWDIAFRFRTKRVSELIHLLSEKIRRLEGVSEVATLPVLPCPPRPSVPDDAHSAEGAESESGEVPDGAPAGSPVVRGAGAATSEAEYAKLWEQGLGVLPLLDVSATRKGVRRADDLLNTRWTNLRMEYRWLAAYTAQLHNAWRTRSNLTNHESADEHAETFEGIRRSIETELKRMSNWDEKINDGNSKCDELAAQLDATQRGENRTRLFDCAFPDGRAREAWEIVRDASEQVRLIHVALVEITSELNERTEGQQAATMTEHLPKIGEQTGIMDLATESVRRLFRHYCSGPESSSPVWGPSNWAPSKKKPDGALNRLHRRWNGIVVSTSREDIGLHIPWQLLYLPLDMKFLIQSKLLILAHEAGHEALYWICKAADGFDKHLPKEVRPKVDSAYESFTSHVWEPMIESSKAWSAGLRTESGQRVEPPLERFLEEDRALYEREFLCDLFALLSSGPGYITDLMSFTYQPADVAAFQEEGCTHPPLWLRIAILFRAAEALGWVSSRDASDEGVACDVEEYNRRFDEFKIYDLVKNHFERYDHLGDGPDAPSLWQELGDVAALACKLATRRGDTPLDPEVAVLGMLTDPERGPKAMRRMVEWAQRHADRALFYPLPGLRPVPDSRKDPAWEAYPRVVKVVNQYVGEVAERLVFNDEVVLDVPLRYVAAATCHSVVPRPHFSNGRILHSLYLSTEADYSVLDGLVARALSV